MKFNQFKIKTEFSNGKIWHTPMRRILLFFWTEYFPCEEKDCISHSMTSTDVKDALGFIIDKKEYLRKRRAAWCALFNRTPQ